MGRRENAAELLARVGEALVGMHVITQAMGDYPGGLARVIELRPDPEAPDIVFTVKNPNFECPHGGGMEIGVLDGEDVELLHLATSRNLYFALVDDEGRPCVTMVGSTSINEETGEISGVKGAASMFNGLPPTWCERIVRVYSFWPWAEAQVMGDFSVIWKRA